MSKKDFGLIKEILENSLDIKKQILSNFSTQYLLTDNDYYQTICNEIIEEIKTIEETLKKLY